MEKWGWVWAVGWGRAWPAHQAHFVGGPVAEAAVRQGADWPDGGQGEDPDRLRAIAVRAAEPPQRAHVDQRSRNAAPVPQLDG